MSCIGSIFFLAASTEGRFGAVPCTIMKMRPTGRLSRVIRIFLAILLVVLFMRVITHSNVDCHAEQGDNFLCSPPSAHQASHVRYPFDNLTMVSPEVASQIQNIWSDELAQVTLEGNRSVTDNMIEAGGQPERVLLITKWRSGSTYVGSILRSMPGTHYVYEPLHSSYRKIVIREESDIHEALRILRNLLNCQIQAHLITKAPKAYTFFSRNEELWSIATGANIQKDPTFMTLMCRRSPVLAMKIVRLGLGQAEALLEDEKLNIKVIYLVRDPRATMNSRLQSPFCKPMPECQNYSQLCSDLVDDYIASKNLERKYPDRFIELRYEDLLTRSETSMQLSQFLGMNITSRITKGSSQVMKWTRKLDGQMDLILNIQEACAEAMNLWGYKPVQTLPTNLSCILQSFVN